MYIRGKKVLRLLLKKKVKLFQMKKEKAVREMRVIIIKKKDIYKIENI